MSSNTVSEQVTYEYDEFGDQDNLGGQANQLEQIKEEAEEEEKEKQIIPLGAIKGLTSSLTSEIIHRKTSLSPDKYQRKTSFDEREDKGRMS